MKKYMSLAIIIFVATLISKPIQLDTAKNIATNWYQAYSVDKTVPNISSIDEIKSNSLVDIFVFNMDNGFILVAGDDASIPVLGYSFDKNFDYSDAKENIKFWMDKYRTSLKEIRENHLSNESTLYKWEEILDKNFSTNVKDVKSVSPLLNTTWSQSPIYNDYCPLDDGHLSVVGCVATAMSQIMKYHSYPLHGDQNSSYYCTSNGINQTLSADYFFSTYNWDQMPNSLSSGSSQSAKHEVAQLCYHAGISVEMMYGSDGSGAYSNHVPNALKTYFKYDESVNYYSRNSYNDTQWNTMILENLDNSLPVYYSGGGYDTDNQWYGHAFVCDGYDTTDYFHFNWGWGGSSNGYYYLDNLNPGGNLSLSI